MWSLDAVLEAVRGVLHKKDAASFSGVSTDSRTIGKGELFIPIVGEKFDGHLFSAAAYERSNAGSLCAASRKEMCRDVPGTVIIVEDTTQALLDLARYKRERIETTCMAITGSNGKTTTKELLVNMLQSEASVHSNEKNYNNLIGVPTSILAVKGNPRFCVFELGTSLPGEIKKLAAAAIPDMSLITNINPSHLEGLKSIEGVLEEKLDLFRLTKEGGTIFFNADDSQMISRISDVKGCEALTFGIENSASFHLSIDKDLGWDGMNIRIACPDGASITAQSRLLGRHNLYNILAAAAMAYAAGIRKESIAAAIENFASYGMRFKPVTTASGLTIIDDTYNANPSSMQWAIKTLAELPAKGKRIAILGDMRELGEKSAQYHADLGKFLSNCAIPVIALIGREMKAAYNELGEGRAKHFEDKRALIDYVRSEAAEGDTVLIKGSRASKMEEIVEALK